jgi:hypothetical protein
MASFDDYAGGKEDFGVGVSPEILAAKNAEKAKK